MGRGESRGTGGTEPEETWTARDGGTQERGEELSIGEGRGDRARATGK